MASRSSAPHIDNKRNKHSQNSSTSAGQSSHASRYFVEEPVPSPGVDWLNRQNLFQYPPVADAQRHASVTQASPEGPTFSDPSPIIRHPDTAVPPDISIALDTKDTSNKSNNQTFPPKFFALIIPVDKVLELGEKLFEEAYQPPLVLARIAPRPPGQSLYVEFYTLQTTGYNESEKLGKKLYLTCSFTKGHPHHKFSSPVCKAFLLRRHESYLEKVEDYRYSASGFTKPGGELSHSKAADILTSSFEKKVQAAYWRGFLQLSQRCGISNQRIAAGVTIHSSHAGLSNLGSFHAVASSVQFTNPQGQFAEPPPTVPQPYRHLSSQEVAFLDPYPSSGSLLSLDESAPYRTNQHDQGAAFAHNYSTSPAKGSIGKRSVFNLAIPTFPTATPDRRVVDRAFNSNIICTDPSAPWHGSIPRINYQITNHIANYHFTYRHIGTTQAPLGDYNAQIAVPRFHYPSTDPDQTDISQAAASSNSDKAVLDQGSVRKELELVSIPLPSHHSVLPRPSVSTEVSPAPVKPQRPRRGRPRKKKVDQPPQPHPPSYHPSIPPEGAQTIAPVYNNVTTEGAPTRNSPQGSYSLPYMSGLHYPPPYNPYHYQPGLVFQAGFTHGAQAASSKFDFEVPAVGSPPQQSNSEDPLRADDMNPTWWDLDLSGGFQ